MLHGTCRTGEGGAPASILFCFFLLKYSQITVLCQFLMYSTMLQSYTNIHFHILKSNSYWTLELQKLS